MKKQLPLIFILIAALAGNSTFGQRYATEIFSSNDVDADVSYGFNVDPFSIPNAQTDPEGFGADMTLLNQNIDDGVTPSDNYFLPNSFLPEEQHTVVKLTQLEMDVYTPPMEDEETSRPLIIYIHTGNFLPPLFNGSITGDKVDSAGVNLCKQWARRGYVAASINYRLGWNPTSSIPDVRRGTLLQAVYRALHDTQSAVRFFRSSVENGNPYGIDPSKIVLYGQGSGGYVSQAYITLNDYISEIAGLDKFVGENGPYVIEAIDGTIDGGPGFTRLPDPLQEAGISKDVNMAINAGGALADISWLDEGEPPMVTFHCIRDPFAPFDNGIVVVPTTQENVVEVQGGNIFVQEAFENGNNSVFSLIEDETDPFTDRARSIYGETYEYIIPNEPTVTVNESPEGLFPFVLPVNTLGGNYFTNEGSPWDWWDLETLQVVVQQTNAALGTEFDASELHAQGVAGNPGMSPDKGLTYIDTIMGYANPRIMCVLELEGNPCVLGVEEVELENTTNVFPNPSQNAVNIRNDEHLIRRVNVMDITGRVVAQNNVNGHYFTLDRGYLNDGIYLMQIVFDDQRITKKVMFN
jgi:hypothetical protein